MDTVELTMAVEGEFGFEIPDEDTQTLDTFGNALAYLREHKTT